MNSFRRFPAVLLCAVGCLLSGLASGQVVSDQDPEAAKTSDDLFAAARSGDFSLVQSIVKSGVDANSKTAYGSTALFFACDRGNPEIVLFLLENGADPNAKDTFYGASPLTWAQNKQSGDSLSDEEQQNYRSIIHHLIRAGVDGVDAMLIDAVTSFDSADKDSQIQKIELAKTIIDAGNVSGEVLSRSKFLATKSESKELAELFSGLEIKEYQPFEPTEEELKVYVGDYSGSGFKVKIEFDAGELEISFNGDNVRTLSPTKRHEFSMGNATAVFGMKEDAVETMVVDFGGNKMTFKPESASTPAENKPETTTPKPDPTSKPDSSASDSTETEFKTDSPESLAADRAVSSANWPGFRGNGARGVAEGQGPPIEWDLTADEKINFGWETKIPGLGNSCPTIWGERLYVTSAVSGDDSGEFKIGQYGSVDSIVDDSVYKFNVYCLDKQTGEIIWQKTAHESKPAVKRHAKSSHANPTIATDGKYVIAFFGSEGLYCYNVDGDLVWKKDFGLLDSGWFYDPGYQWGFGASPFVFEGRVFVQCDIQGGSFVTAFDIETGKEIWRTEREEIPTWSSPVVHRFGDVPMLITHGTHAARGYDARDGTELWTLPKHSEIVVPTPFVAHDMIYLASGYRPVQPVYAIHPSARGDISLEGDESSSDTIAWSVQRGGPYMPTPICYGDYLYTCANNGILICYEAKTGKIAYKQRMKAPGGNPSFTASPIAADGHLYFTNEDGRILVVKAGPTFELVGVNKVGANTLATPAISEGTIFFRTQNSVIAIRSK